MRSVRFVPDGKHRLVEPADVVAAWRAVTTIPAQFAVGTAQHESSFTLNEDDTESSGFVSKGLFQLSDEEAKEEGMAGADLLKLETQCELFGARLCARRLREILQAAKIVGELPLDVWAYLYLAHNQGIGRALETIRLHGLDWQAYKDRNIAAAIRTGNPRVVKKWRARCAYGDDVISGGPFWSPEFDEPTPLDDGGAAA